MIYSGFMLHGLYEYLTFGKEHSPVLYIALTLACIIIPYLIGSFNFAVIISKSRYGEDIRTKGSGNGGTTNMQRTYGNRAAVFTMVGDMLKAVVAVTVGCALMGLVEGGYMAAFFCVLGHMFPLYYRFKGGKGVATSAAAMLMLNPVVFFVILFVFVFIVFSTKYVSLGSVMAALLYPVILHRINTITVEWYKANGIMWGSDVIFAFLMAMMVVFMHRSNIKRLMNHTESKLSIGKKKENSENENK
ncbi:MAG: glycerol-3-phosphate 1-O-acyltransferase PlsY [Clostridia bacterium]|nr:glycerol-3-phosphate 1-O-acyltransferase PlsY [Clostridia bacterium]